MDLGTLIEGVVELDPMTGRMVLRVQQLDGSCVFVDIQDTLEKYKGEEVRFIMTPIRTIEELTRLVEAGDLALDDVPRLKVPDPSN